MGSRGPATSALVASVLIGCTSVLERPAAQDRLDVAAVVARISDSLVAYYRRAQRIICVERSTVVPIDARWNLQGFGRTVESELRVETEAVDGDALPEARVMREIRRVNGRAPRDADRTGRSGCTDPPPLSPEPLAFLLPAQRDEYSFTAVRTGREQNRAALIVDFASARRGGHPELIEDEYGHDDCFDWRGPVPVRGRLWVDASTYDVLRLDRHLAGPTDIRISPRLQRRYGFPSSLTVDRDDVSLTFEEVRFTEPDEVLLLPASIESVTILRSGLQSTRRTQIFTDYRRFLTRARIVGDGQPPQWRP